MNIGFIGRSELLYNSIVMLKQAGHAISVNITSDAYNEYKRQENDFE